MSARTSTPRKAASKKAVAKKKSAAADEGTAKAPGIGRSAITGRFMSVRAAKAHKKTAVIEGARRKRS